MDWKSDFEIVTSKNSSITRTFPDSGLEKGEYVVHVGSINPEWTGELPHVSDRKDPTSHGTWNTAFNGLCGLKHIPLSEAFPEESL